MINCDEKPFVCCSRWIVSIIQFTESVPLNLPMSFYLNRNIFNYIPSLSAPVNKAGGRFPGLPFSHCCSGKHKLEEWEINTLSGRTIRVQFGNSRGMWKTWRAERSFAGLPKPVPEQECSAMSTPLCCHLLNHFLPAHLRLGYELCCKLLPRCYQYRFSEPSLEISLIEVIGIPSTISDHGASRGIIERCLQEW